MNLEEKIAFAVKVLSEKDWSKEEKGIHEVNDFFYYNVLEYNTKDTNQGLFESHKKYLDIQMMIDGEEMMDVIEINSLKIKENYDEKNDIIFYYPENHHLQTKMVKGSYIVLYPENGHRGCGKVGNPKPVRKVVGKVLI